MKYRFLYVWALCVVLLSGNATAGFLNAEEFYLNNGMQVIVVPNHRTPIVKHMVWYRTGAADEVAGKGGSAHLLEHLMFRGTKKVPGNELNNLLEVNGASSNAFTGQDMTTYHQLLDVSRLELAMFLEADRMTNLRISDEDFATERDIVFQERKERIDNDPMGYFREAVNRALWQTHPYAKPVIGIDEEIKLLEKDDVWEYYKAKYNPSNAILVMSGDIDVDTAKKLAQKYYGNIEVNGIKNEKKFAELSEGSKVVVDMKSSHIKGFRVLKNWASPSFATNKEDVYNLYVLAEYMGGGKTAKLYKKLVEEKKKALDVAVKYNPIARSYGVFAISVVPADDVRPEEILQELEKSWMEALEELSIDELEKTKQKMLAGLIYWRDNPEDAAYMVGAMAVAGVSLQEIEQQDAKIKTVRYKEVKKAAEKLWNDAPQVIGILRPKGDDDNA